MVKLETEIALPASPKQVWQILTDFKSFPEWNSIEIITGEAELNSKLTVKTSAVDGSGAIYSFKAVIINFEPEKHLAWKGGIPGLLSGVHYWRLSATETGTNLIHGQNSPEKIRRASGNNVALASIKSEILSPPYFF